MQIEKIEIESFGKFKNFSMELKDGVNVIYGENEAGKSTICSFLYAMFYDLPSTRQKTSVREDLRKRYTPWSGENMSGAVYFSHDGKKYILKRILGKTPRGSKVELIDGETWEQINDARKEEPGKFFFGVGEDGFLKTLYISQLGAKISHDKNDEIIERLSNLKQSGDEDVSYQKTLDKLTKQKHSLISVSGSTGKIVALDKENEELEIKLQEVLKDEKAYKESLAKKTEALSEKEVLLDKIKDLEKGRILAKKYENYLKMQEAKEKLAELDKEFEKLSADFSQSEERLQKIREKEVEFGFLENADEETVNILIETEKKNAVLEQQIVDFNEKKNQASEIEKQIENIKLTKKGKVNIAWLLSGAILLLASGILTFVVSYVCSLGFILSAASFVLAFVLNSAKREAAAKIKELTAKLDAIKPDANEENAILKEQKENREKADAILKSTRSLNSADLLTKLSEKKNLAEIKMSAEKENTLIKDNFNKVKVDSEFLREKATVTAYPEGVLNVPTFVPDEIEKEKDRLSNELISCEKRISEAEATLLSLSKDEKSSSEIKMQIEINNKEKEEMQKLYQATQKAILMIEDSYGILRSDFAPILSEKVKEAANALTYGKYTDVRVSDDYNLKVQSGGDIVDADFLSGGTYDILYLALRLGISKVISKDAIPLLILDDTFLQLDDSRQKIAADYIKNNSAKQILYFTCHKNQCEIFGTDGVSIINF